LLNVLDTVAKAGASFRSIGDAWCDTTTPHGRLMLTVLGGLAEFERELIRERTGEGRRRAMAAGVRFGRPPVLTAFQKAEAYKRRKACLVPERPHWRATVSDRASLSRQRQHHRKAIAMTKREVPAPADPRHLHRG
jgi:DNA invertase Pin-like site-specific DNA recombinase